MVNEESLEEPVLLKEDDRISFGDSLPDVTYHVRNLDENSAPMLAARILTAGMKHKMSPREPCSSRYPGGSSPSHDGFHGSFKVPRVCRTVPSSPIWQLSPSHDSFHGDSRLASHNAWNRRLCQERDMLIDEWMRVLKSREEALTLAHPTLAHNKDLRSLEALKAALRSELTVEYNVKLVDAEDRLKAEMASRDKLQEVLSSELNMKDSQLLGEKKKLQETVEILESELQCSICSELFIRAVTLGCSHSFCEFCISQWRGKPHSHQQCPICRAHITTEVRSLVLDQYINRVVAHLDQDLLEVRNELVRQRKELDEMQVLTEKMQSSGEVPSGSGHIQIPISGPSGSVHSRVTPLQPSGRRYTPVSSRTGDQRPGASGRHGQGYRPFSTRTRIVAVAATAG
jgi:hypothetical protein